MTIASTATTAETFVQLIKEKPTKKRVLEFEHNNEKFDAEVTYRYVLDGKGVLLTIRIHSMGNYYGMIDGYFKLSKDNKREFYSNYLNNADVSFDKDTDHVTKSIGHIPQLMREVVAQFLLRNIIEVWHSSTSPTQGGIQLYEALIQDPRLMGIKKSVTVNVENDMTPQTKIEYVLKKNETAN